MTLPFEPCPGSGSRNIWGIEPFDHSALSAFSPNCISRFNLPHSWKSILFQHKVDIGQSIGKRFASNVFPVAEENIKTVEPRAAISDRCGNAGCSPVRRKYLTIDNRKPLRHEAGKPVNLCPVSGPHLTTLGADGKHSAPTVKLLFYPVQASAPGVPAWILDGLQQHWINKLHD